MESVRAPRSPLELVAPLTLSMFAKLGGTCLHNSRFRFSTPLVIWKPVPVHYGVHTRDVNTHASTI